MKLTTYAQTLHDLNVIKDQGFTEVILGHRDFARFGKLSDDDFLTLSQRAKELNLRVLFEWDILMTENVFAHVSQQFPKFEKVIDAIRVQDPGALEWSIKNSTNPLQFIAENGNHNLKALQGWIDYASGRIERIVLSIELTKTVIEEYVQKLSVPCELLGFGRILLFYTPRSLLSPLNGDKVVQNDELASLGESEESPHKGFPIVENKHGTFMFHIKEFCLIEYAEELKTLGLKYLRLDVRWENIQNLASLNLFINKFDSQKFDEYKSIYSQDLMRGFYLVNKTDVLFPKLKNHRLQKREGDYVGEVMEAEKGAHLAVMVKNPKGLTVGESLKILHPKGEEIAAKVYSLRTASMEEVNHIPAGQLALIQYVGGVWVKSQIFYQN